MSVVDPFDARRVHDATGLPALFNAAGVLAAADVHVARRLGALAGETDEEVLLAAALAVRAPRIGHVHVDLATIAAAATVDADEPVDVGALPWPPAEGWVARVAGSALVAVGDGDGEDAAARPLRLVGSRLHLDRYWREERQVAEDLATLAGAAPEVDADALASGIARLFGAEAGGRQSLAAASAVLGGLTVVAGGPGTGKTTTVARVLALLLEQAAALGRPAPLVALAAPTGKAAARLQEAVHEEAAHLDVTDDVRAALLGFGSSTLHRLLGRRPGSASRFRHHRRNRLPHDVVVVDETSMVSLSLMARLAEAVRPDARLVLVGDPQQLASVEAGAVLGDVVGVADGVRATPARRAALSAAVGGDVDAADAPSDALLADGVVVLHRVHRFGAGIAAVADAVRRGDADAAVAALRSGGPDVGWIEQDAGAPDAPAGLDAVREGAVGAALAVADAAHAGDARAALDALARFRLLCAHRRGEHGVATWTARVEAWVAHARPDLGVGRRWYAGRPLLVTANDPELQLSNGDTGVVVAEGERLAAAFERRGEVVTVSPSRLEAVESLHALTIHKAQGSQVGTAVVLLPGAGSRILTRELLYTAVTRARERLVVVGTEDVLRAAVARPVARASGLGAALRRA